MKRRARRGTRIRAIARTALVTATVVVMYASRKQQVLACLFLSREGETGTQRNAMILSYF